MKSFAIICFVAVLALVLAASVMGQDLSQPSLEAYKFDFTGGGARAEGMGKAFIAVSDDITAGSWNPAGLYVQEKPILGVSYGSLAPRGFTNTNVGLKTWTFDHTGSFNNITSLHFLAPIRIKGHHFVGSFNYTRNFDEFQGYGYSQQFSGIYYEFNIPIYEINTDWSVASELQGGLNSVNLGFGTRMYKNVSFGASLNIYLGETVRDQLFVSDIDWVPVDTEVVLPERRVFTENVIDTNKFSGFNFTVGLRLNGEKLDAGLVVRTPFSLNVKTGRSIYDLGRRGASGGNLLIFYGDTTYYDNLLSKYEMPLMVGAGVAYRPSENLLLAIDMEFRKFSGAKIKARDSLLIDPGGENREFFTELDPEWNNVFIVRLGGEHLRQTRIGVVPLRAGLGYVPIPAPSVDLSGRKSTAAGYNFSLGTGIHWNQINLDWAYTYTTLKWERVSVEQKSRNHHLNFTFTGYF